jgi:hypothetical protein
METMEAIAAEAAAAAPAQNKRRRNSSLSGEQDTKQRE